MEFNIQTGFIATKWLVYEFGRCRYYDSRKITRHRRKWYGGRSIAQVASFYNIPVLNVRGVSDHVGGDAPDTFEETLEKASQNAFEAVRIIVENFL